MRSRLPYVWNLTHLADKSKARIDPKWLNRVKEMSDESGIA